MHQNLERKIFTYVLDNIHRLRQGISQWPFPNWLIYCTTFFLLGFLLFMVLQLQTCNFFNILFVLVVSSFFSLMLLRPTSLYTSSAGFKWLQTFDVQNPYYRLEPLLFRFGSIALRYEKLEIQYLDTIYSGVYSYTNWPPLNGGQNWILNWVLKLYPWNQKNKK